MKYLSIVLFAVFSLSLLIVVTLSLLAPQIEFRLKNNVITTLTKNNLLWVSVSAEGRTIALKGVAPTRWLRTKVDKLVLAVSGIEYIDNQITIAAPLSDYNLMAYYDGRQLDVRGHILDPSSRQYINDRIIAVYGKDNVVSQWDFNEGQPLAWETVSSGVIATLKILKQGKVVFNNQTIHITGTTDSTELKKQLEDKIRPYFQQGYRIQSTIEVITPAISCQEKFKTLLEKDSILFANGSAVIDKSSNGLLGRLKIVMDECERFGVIIGGHTDSMSDEKPNQILSLSRAKAVANYLIKQGVNAGRIKTIGYGESQPIADNETQEGRAKNRRIEFIIEGV